MTAEEIMSDNVTTVEETAPISEAVEALSELYIRHIPVVRGSEVVGMLSDRDLRSIGLSLVSDIEGLDKVRDRMSDPVSTLMSGDVITIDRSADLTEIIDLMMEEKVGAIPVVEEDSSDLVGILSYVDVLRAARSALE
ncbi:MAG: CBS domain-containing protein [Polyangiales bacterium]